MPSVPVIHPALPSVYPGIREVLEANRAVFVEWRYIHERLGGRAETTSLKGSAVGDHRHVRRAHTPAGVCGFRRGPEN